MSQVVRSSGDDLTLPLMQLVVELQVLIYTQKGLIKAGNRALLTELQFAMINIKQTGKKDTHV